MDAFSRRNRHPTASAVEAELWARQLRHRWLVRTADLLAAHLARTIARARSRALSSFPPRQVATEALLDPAVRPRSAGG